MFNHNPPHGSIVFTFLCKSKAEVMNHGAFEPSNWKRHNKHLKNSNKSCICVGLLVSRKGFLCLACGAVMDEPSTKMQLEVFLSCSSLSHCTVKIKVRCFQMLYVESFHSHCRHKHVVVCMYIHIYIHTHTYIYIYIYNITCIVFNLYMHIHI